MTSQHLAPLDNFGEKLDDFIAVSSKATIGCAALTGVGALFDTETALSLGVPITLGIGGTNVLSRLGRRVYDFVIQTQEPLSE